jgi:hypothetical protein
MIYILRLIGLPFITGLLLIYMIYYVILKSYHFILYGGEFIIYNKDDKKMIYDIYEQLKTNKKE